MKTLLLIAIAGGYCFAQGRTVTLNWSDNSNPAGTTYTVKRAPGLCSGTPTYGTVATGVTVKTFVENNVAIGNQCYIVTASFGGLESQPSNAANAAVLPSKPNIDSITVAEADGERVLVASVNVPLLTAEDVF